MKLVLAIAPVREHEYPLRRAVVAGLTRVALGRFFRPPLRWRLDGTMMTNVTQTARYHFSVKQTRDGNFSVVFEAVEGDIFETAGIWMGMRSQRAADEL